MKTGGGKRMRMMALALVLAAGVHAAETFPLVDGEIAAVIVGDVLTPGWPYEGPKNLLQAYVEQSTGRRLESVAEKDYDETTMPYAIFVGRTSRAEQLFGERLRTMSIDDYIVAVYPTFVVLVGATAETTAWAQYDFLREYLGVDAYFPHRLGLVVPKHATVRIPVETRLESPVYKNRGFWAFNAEGKAGRGWCAGTIPWRTPMQQRRFEASHTIQTLIPVKEFGQTHPEYFPMVDGKRKITDSGHEQAPCIANPEVVTIIIAKVRQYFDQHPQAESFSLGMTDGGFCECPECQALDGPAIAIAGCTVDSSKSQRWYSFLNQVAVAIQQSHPGRIITTLGYARCDLPPRDIAVERNIMPFLCATRSTWFDPEVRRTYLEITDAWLDRVDQIGVYEYFYGASLAIPMLYSHDMADYLRHVAGKSRSGQVAFFGEINASWGMDGPKVWILEKLLWNPEADVDALTRRWCEAVFEEAAAPMIRYFQTLERMRVNNAGRLSGITQYIPWKGKAEPLDLQNKFGLWQKSCQLLLFPPEDVAHCQQLLSEARAMATQDIVRQRIEYFASTFKLTEYASKTYHAYTGLNERQWNGAGPAELMAALLEGEDNLDPVDVLEFTQRMMAADHTRFHGPTILLDGCGLAVRKIVLETAGKRIADLLAEGVADQEQLIAAAQQALMAVVPPGVSRTEAQQRRLQSLRAMASRIVMAPRTQNPPTIDGNFDEPIWQWVEQHPWFNWQSAVEDPHTRTSMAFAHDDRFLYVAVRCPQADLAAQPRCLPKDGSRAFQYPSIELFLNADQPGVERDKLAYYQAIPAFGGGFMESGGGSIGDAPQAMAAHAITEDADAWQAELKIDLRQLGLLPTDHRYLRINLVRNLGSGGFSGRTWFPSPAAHKEPDSRGWLVFGQ